MEQLRSRIIELFPLAPIPEAPIIRTYDDENIIPTFLGRAWNSFTVRELRDHNAAINFLTPVAFAYYLPGFLIASIEDPTTADIIPDHLLATFANGTDVVSHLTSAQCRVVADFLSSYAGDDPHQSASLTSAHEVLARNGT